VSAVAGEVSSNQNIDGKQAIMSILERAAVDSQFLAELAENPRKALDGVYNLTREELAAMVSGDIATIEKWVGKLDQKQATWLWCRLCQEKW
jgi:hypothetical protein